MRITDLDDKLVAKDQLLLTRTSKNMVGKAYQEVDHGTFGLNPEGLPDATLTSNGFSIVKRNGDIVITWTY